LTHLDVSYSQCGGDKPVSGVLCSIRAVCPPGDNGLQEPPEELLDAWAYGAWSSCSVTCGIGTQTRVAVCTTTGYAVINGAYCGAIDLLTRSCDTSISC
jgi:hypothetical protein